MQLPMVNFASADEDATYNYRWSLFEKFINEQDANSSISINDNENKVDPEIVSILNLPSLKRGIMASKAPSAKLVLISSDKERLNSWITNYKNQLGKSTEKDSVKIATFHEAASRLIMLLDHSDFDEGDLRNDRRKAIREINDMLSDIGKL